MVQSFLVQKRFRPHPEEKRKLENTVCTFENYTDLSQRTMLVTLSSEGLPRHLLKLKLALILWWSDLDPFVQ